jgi:hypothetical protein
MGQQVASKGTKTMREEMKVGWRIGYDIPQLNKELQER